MAKKSISAILVAALLVGLFMPVSVLGANASYDIENPYETVDWATWNQYRAQLHAHTLYSDGTMDIKDVVEEYYAQDYDILAITDHGVVNQGWNKVPELLDLIGYNQYINNFTPVSAERYAELTTGVGRDGRAMLDVNQGIEMNALVMRKNHVNGFFCGWGQGYLGIEEDYRTAVAGVDGAGGISFLNHPGDFFAANKYPERADDPEYLKYFTDVLMEFDSCVGVEAFNRIDTADRSDRIVWDNLLQYTIPRGRNVWAFANDDSHELSDIGCTVNLMLMPELTNDALRTAMEDGTFFACSRYARNELGEDFVGTGEYAKISYVEVDDEADQITVIASDYDTIEWISDGEIIATGSTIDLREYSDEIGCYVRFQIKNEGGIVCSQAFVCNDGDMSDSVIEYPEKADLNLLSSFFNEILSFLRRTIIGEIIYKNLYL